MRHHISATLITIVVSIVGCLQVQAVEIDKLVESGKYLYVFNTPETGDSIIAIGVSASGSSENERFEIARTDAYKKLTSFLNGEKMNSVTEYKLRSSQGEVSKSFLSTRSSSVSGIVRSAQEVQVGSTSRGRFYVALQLSEKSVAVSSKLKRQLDDNTVASSGYSSLESGIEKARRIALDSALRNAVAMYNGVGAAGQSTVTDATDLRSSMATRASGVVTNYRITFEGKVEGSYKVEIVATVEDQVTDPSQISKTVRENMGRPTIYVQTNDAVARNALTELLVTEDFDVTTDLPSARFVLNVKSEYDERPTLGDMLGRRTTLILRLNDVLSSDPAIVLSNNPDKSLEASDNKRIRKSRSMLYAVEDIKGELIAGLADNFVDQFNNGTKVSLSFSNFGKLRYVDKFVELLEGLPLTKKASLRPVQDGVAYVDLLYLGDPTELQMLVVKSAQKYKLFGLKAKNKSSAGLEFTF